MRVRQAGFVTCIMDEPIRIFTGVHLGIVERVADELQVTLDALAQNSLDVEVEFFLL